MQISVSDIPIIFDQIYRNPLTNGALHAVNHNGHVFDVQFALQDQQPHLFFLNRNKNHCITIGIRRDCVYLDNYYYAHPKNQCPFIEHAHFFDFIKALAVVYNVDVKLFDASKKAIDFTSCVLPMEIFALANLPTFYQRFGFENESFMRYIRKKQSYNFEEYAERSSNDEEYQTALAILKRWDFTPETSFRRIAKRIINNCKAASTTNKSRTESVEKSRKTLKKHNRFLNVVTDNEAFLATYMFRILMITNEDDFDSNWYWINPSKVDLIQEPPAAPAGWFTWARRMVGFGKTKRRK
jgi:hypothetical protein